MSKFSRRRCPQCIHWRLLEGLFVMISTLSSDVPLRSEHAWSRPLEGLPAFTCCAFPHSFLFHSPIFSSMNPCPTLRSHLCPQQRQPTHPTHPTHPLPQPLFPQSRDYFIHDFLILKTSLKGEACAEPHPVNEDQVAYQRCIDIWSHIHKLTVHHTIKEVFIVVHFGIHICGFYHIKAPWQHSCAIKRLTIIFIAGLVFSRDEKAFLPHDFTSCANAILMKDWDVGLWQNQ